MRGRPLCCGAASPSLVLVLALAASSLAAQTVWTVTTPDGVQAAIAAASPGDVIVLGGGGSYHPFTLDKGLTIRGNGALVGYAMGAVQDSVVLDIPPGQVAHIERLVAHSPFGNIGCPVLVNGGTACFEQCTLLAERTPLRVSNAAVVVSGSTITSSAAAFAVLTTPAIVATASDVTLRDCVVTGPYSTVGYPFPAPVPARSAVAVSSGSALRAENVQFVGGSQNTTASLGAPAVEVLASSARLADCTLNGGNGTTGGTALVNAGNSLVELRNTVLIGGQANGAPSSGPFNPNAPLVRLAIAPGWTRGSTSTLTCRGDPNALFGIALAPDALPTSVTFVVEPIWFVTGQVVTGGVLDPTGTATLPVVVPNLPALQHQTVWCQAVAGNALPLRASTVAGGVIR